MAKFYPFKGWLVAFALATWLPLNAQQFINPIPIPPEINSDTVELQIDILDHVFNPNGTDSLSQPIQCYAFNVLGDTSLTCLGPTIAWQYLHNVHTEVTNNLPHGATVHWHGAHIPVYTDGGPHQVIPPNPPNNGAAGNPWCIDFPILDKSATMWYHPHVMDHTYEQVQMGMSGMIYVEDPVDGDDDPILSQIHDTLPNEYGVNDFPVIVQTKKFIPDPNNPGGHVIDTANGYKGSDFRYVINGVVNAYMEVPANVVRLRILNGDAKWSFNLGVFENADGTSPYGFQYIAGDAGYTDSTYAMDSVIIPPGSRFEWLVDFRGQENKTFYLANGVSTIPDAIVGSGVSGGLSDSTILEIRVTAVDTPNSPISAFPIALHPKEIPDTTDQDRHRVKSFTGAGNMGDPFLIDNTPMNMGFVNDTVPLDSTEIWTIFNETRVAHPWHIHDIHFWVTEIFDTVSNSYIDPALYPELFCGPRDNVLIMPGWKMKWVGTFQDYGTAIAPDSTYMYHCHILPHEDGGMMGQFVVWNGLGVGVEEYFEDHLDAVIYPNPAQEELFLKGKSRHPSDVRIFDLQGRLLARFAYTPFDGQIKIPTERLPRGMVMVEWRTEEGKFVRRVRLD